ncbi:MAG: ribonuclease H-like domain-containing protein [Candidatus Saliniplasma sp.]
MEPDSNIYRSERLKWKLISKHKGECLEDLVQGDIKENKQGTFYELREEIDIKLDIVNGNSVERELFSDLKLIPGIGKKTEKKLKNNGIQNQQGLKDNERFRDHVNEMIDEIESRDLYRLQQRVEKYYPLNHPLNRKLMGLTEKENLLFFDIETMGLRYCPVFLIGIGTYSDGNLKVKQLLARNLKEEKAVIREFLDISERYDCFVSFNGRSFDSRFISERMKNHDLVGNLDKPHFDVLHFSKGMWRNDNDIPNHRLGTLEKHVLNKERENDVSSAMVPQFYKIYLKKRNPGPLIPILEHNKEDIVSLAQLLNLLCKEKSRC